MAGCLEEVTYEQSSKEVGGITQEENKGESKVPSKESGHIGEQKKPSGWKGEDSERKEEERWAGREEGRP